MARELNAATSNQVMSNMQPAIQDGTIDQFVTVTDRVNQLELQIPCDVSHGVCSVGQCVD